MYMGTENTGISMTALGMVGVIAFVLVLLAIVCKWKIFQKAEFDGWQSLIPFLSTYRWFEIACGSGWKMVFLLIPGVNLVCMAVIAHKMSKAFGYGILLTLLQFAAPHVALVILAFGNNDYFGAY